MKTKMRKFGAWLMAMALAFAGAGAGLSDFVLAEARDGNEAQVAKRMEFLKGICTRSWSGRSRSAAISVSPTGSRFRRRR